FPAQVSDGELADRVPVLGVCLGGDFPVVGNNRFAGQVGVGNVRDVVAPVAIFRPAFVLWSQSFHSGLNRQGEIVDLGTRIVVVKFTGHVIAVGFQQAA